MKKILVTFAVLAVSTSYITCKELKNPNSEKNKKPEIPKISDKELAKNIQILTSKGETMKNVDFSLVVKATTGKKILSVDKSNPIDLAIIELIAQAADHTLAKMNAPDSPSNGIRRINEASRFFEDIMMEYLNKVPGYSCTIPKNESGKQQRSGYPDLLLKHESSGIITYIDPKLYEKGNEKSSFRTFYFEPKTRTNKILHDAHHLILGIKHDGNSGKWKYIAWSLSDLYKFKIKLKAEFQASNKEMYHPETLIKTSKAKVE